MHEKGKKKKNQLRESTEQSRREPSSVSRTCTVAGWWLVLPFASKCRARLLREFPKEHATFFQWFLTRPLYGVILIGLNSSKRGSLWNKVCSFRNSQLLPGVWAPFRPILNSLCLYLQASNHSSNYPLARMPFDV